VDVAEVLAERPLPGTFRHAMERELSSEGQCLRKEQMSEQNKEEFERVKRLLRGS
jgi:hypothetical protein